MKEKELNCLGGIGYYIDWSLTSFEFVCSVHPPKESLLFDINEKWVFDDGHTTMVYCDKLNNAMKKSGYTEEVPPIKPIKKGTRVHVPRWSTEEGKFCPAHGYFEPLVLHFYRHVFLSEEECQNYCNHLNDFVKKIEPK